jgi:hypothetical protein
MAFSTCEAVSPVFISWDRADDKLTISMNITKRVGFIWLVVFGLETTLHLFALPPMAESGFDIDRDDAKFGK